MTTRGGALSCRSGSDLRRFPCAARRHCLAAAQPRPPRLTLRRGLARDHESVRSALQTNEPGPDGNRQSASTSERAENFAGAPNSRSQSTQDRRDLSGNDRARSPRFDERRRNYFPPRADAGSEAENRRINPQVVCCSGPA